MATMIRFGVERVLEYESNGMEASQAKKEQVCFYVKSFENGIAILEPTLGTSISDFAELVAGVFEDRLSFMQALITALVAENNEVFIGIQFDFNGVTILVTKENADKEKICKAYLDGLEANAEKRRIEFEAYKKTTEYQKKRARQLKCAIRKETVMKEAISVGESTNLLFKGEEAKKIWEQYLEANSKHFYGHNVVTFAERWAKYMQYLMEKHNKNVADIAENAHFACDVEGITGFMYGCAVSILAECWKYGEELRKWHNKECGHEEVDGVVNPAVLTIAANK